MSKSLYALALCHGQAGRTAEAESLLRLVVADEPQNAMALEALAQLLYQRQDLGEAAEMFGRATMAAPHAPHLHAALGFVLARQGRYSEAAQCLRHALVLSPNNANFLAHLAAVLRAQGAIDEAIDTYYKAIAAQPSFPEAYSNLGNLLTRPGQFDEAIRVLRQAIAQKPDFAEAHANLAVALREAGRLDEALDACHRALALRPALPEAQFSLGLTLAALKRNDDAIVAFRKALELRPSDPEAHHALGAVLLEKDECAEALHHFQAASAQRSSYLEPQYAMGNALARLGRIDEAICVHRRMLGQSPRHPKARLGLALELLLKGEFKEGWELYESRPDPPNPPGPRPRWTGEELAGRRILLESEQGYGDVIQFIRYVPLIRERGGRVAVRTYPPLHRLLYNQLGIEQVAEIGQAAEFDVYCPVMSLPGIFGTTLATIPADVPYLFADAQLCEQWARRIDRAAELRVGLVWAGKREHGMDRARSMALATLSALGRVRGARFYSLQVGPAAQQAKSPPPQIDLIDYSAELSDFAETAALISQLDLVISPDTAVAHLAGALGRKVWVMLPMVPDWRWLLDRPDSPWYPTMRLFRQRRAKEWGSVIEQMAEELEELVNE